MARFIELKDRDGKAVLVNIDRVTAVTFDNENNAMRLFTADGTVDLPVCGREEFLKPQQDESGTLDRMSGNLFHIWEILRARLH